MGFFSFERMRLNFGREIDDGVRRREEKRGEAMGVR
jgi:hypothetical protein